MADIAIKIRIDGVWEVLSDGVSVADGPGAKDALSRTSLIALAIALKNGVRFIVEDAEKK